jgi:hypothetical protein
MIPDIFLNLLSAINYAVADHLPSWQLWPSPVMQGLYYFFAEFKTLNFILPIAEWFSAFLLLIGFFSVWLPFRLLLRAFKRH